MDKTNEKCAHPSCGCSARSDSKYCSTYCEGQADTAASTADADTAIAPEKTRYSLLAAGGKRE